MATTYLTRTFGTPTNNKIFTFSAWMKRGAIGVADEGFFSTGASGDPITTFRWNTDGKLYLFYLSSSSMVWEFATNALYRDCNGWYHVVIAFDSTESSAGDRFKLWVNGEQVTSWSTQVNPALNSSPTMNSAMTHVIGTNWSSGGNTFTGLMSHVHFVDGTAYPASTFGSTDATSGEWVINTSPSVTYGTNGFFILKDGNSVTDQSGEGNNWTVDSGTLTDLQDCPDDVFATLNPLYLYGTTSNAYNNGNTAFNTTTTAWASTFSTLGMTKGKFYAEMKVVNLVTNNGYMNLGIQGLDLIGSSGNTNANFIANSGSAGMEMDYRGGTNNSLYSGGGSELQDAGVDWTNGDIVGLAVDMDNKGFYIHKNGTYLTVGGSVGDPTSGATKTGAITIPASITTCGFGIGGYTTHAKGAFNFGNGYFETTAISSEGTNASSIGKFEYDVPTGYTALSTKGLNS